MSPSKPPRGTVKQVFTNGNGQMVGVIRWTRGEGPPQIVADYGLRVGQTVTVRDGKAVVA